MSAAVRIYRVTITGAPDRLVRSPNVAQAVRHVARSLISADLASQDDLVRLVAAGVKVEDAGTESEAS